MIEGVRSADQYLYHYTPCPEVILKSRTLRFGAYSKTNDPKESKVWEFNLGTNENANFDKYDMKALGTWLSTEIKSKTRIACFAMDAPPLSGNHLADIFRRGFCKPRMWAQYANRHKGACLVFDRQKLYALIDEQFRSSHLIISGPVVYLNRDVIPRLEDTAYTIDVDYLETMGRDEYLKWHRQTYFKQFFFEKMTDWRDELEFRWVILGTDANDLYVTFDGALVGIMFGDDAEESTIDEIKTMTAGMGLRYMGLKWKNCSPWYDFGNLKYLGLKI